MEDSMEFQRPIWFVFGHQSGAEVVDVLGVIQGGTAAAAIVNAVARNRESGDTVERECCAVDILAGADVVRDALLAFLARIGVPPQEQGMLIESFVDETRALLAQRD